MNGRSVAFLLFMFCGCGASRGVERHPVPSTEKLRSADCDIGMEVYKTLLALPPHASILVGERATPSPPQSAQDLALVAFSQECHSSLVDHVRRTIVRCWSDSQDATIFRACSGRF